MGSANIPPPREDDPEEVADKLSIAAAMWARGETHDALQWLRRAAESASDAEADMRALELAKAAAELANAAPAAAPAAPASTAQPAARPLQSTAPTGVKPTTGMPPPKHSAPPAKPMSRPAPPKPSMRPGGPPAGSGKLAPLPPLRPLGTPPPPKPGPRRSESGTSAAVSAAAPPVQNAAPAPALAPLIDETIDHEQTSVMPAAEAQNLARMGGDAMPRPPVESEEADHLQTMRRDAGEAVAPATHQDIHVAETMDPSNPVFAQGHAAAAAQAAEAPASERQPVSEAALPLAVGVRVRVFATEGGAWIVPDDGHGDRGGTAAILVPASPDDDLRSVFPRR